MKSFSVPAPPPQSAPSTPQQKHIGITNIIYNKHFKINKNILVTVRPQGSSSPFKKNNYAALNNSPSTSAMTSTPKMWKSPLTGVNQRDTVPDVDSLSKIQVIIKFVFLK